MHTIGIIGAMEEEVALLKEKMTEVEVTKKQTWSFSGEILWATRLW